MEKMGKLRLDYFLGLGLKLVDGDVILNERGNARPVSNAKWWNCWAVNDSKKFIESLAWRKNTGEQPCGGDIPVEVCFNNKACHEPLNVKHSVKECKAKIQDWGDCSLTLSIDHWRPSVDGLIKMQQEHDKLMNIVEVVNYYNAAWPEKVTYGGDEVITINGCISGDEFDQCVKELSEAAWMNKDDPGQPMYYDVYKQAWRDMREEGVGGNLMDEDSPQGIANRCGDLLHNLSCELQYAKIGEEISKLSSCCWALSSRLVEIEAAKKMVEAEREEKAKALYGVYRDCSTFGAYCAEWDHILESVRESYRNMIDAGVKLPEGE